MSAWLYLAKKWMEERNLKEIQEKERKFKKEYEKEIQLIEAKKRQLIEEEDKLKKENDQKLLQNQARALERKKQVIEKALLDFKEQQKIEAEVERRLKEKEQSSFNDFFSSPKNQGIFAFLALIIAAFTVITSVFTAIITH
jgi:predicted DNA-binding ArsR family transcriptional regulator